MADRAVTQGPTQSQLAATTVVVGLPWLPREAPRATGMSGQVSTRRAEWTLAGGCLRRGTWVMTLLRGSEELGQVRCTSTCAPACVCTCAWCV